jgi:hypothetical protein
MFYLSLTNWEKKLISLGRPVFDQYAGKVFLGSFPKFYGRGAG